MFFGFISSPVNCGAIAMVLSLIVVPLVSLFTPAVPFELDGPAEPRPL
jgi:SSS family solute:Na+ symporter/sodium/proline symporter